MSSIIDIRPAEISDVAAIAPSVRQPDIDELWASVRMAPYEALMASFRVSRDTAFTATSDGEPMCMFGVKAPSMLGSVAMPWMIASDRLEFNSRTFLRKSRQVLKIVSEQFPHMQNYVDARNVVAVRWLQWVGFLVYYPEPYGIDNLPFHRFELKV